jgi:hypothetical protein
MGFFDLLKTKKAAAQSSQPAPDTPTEPGSPASSPSTKSSTQARLSQANACLEAKDLAGALAIYEPLLAEAGERADILVSISGELGAHGHVTEIIELIAPRYDASRHGPATGINIIQAYLALRNIEAAQHVLDILFALDRPELEERLFGFSNAIAELIEERRKGVLPNDGPGGAIKVPHINLITISKPVWFYGLEAMQAELLPPKDRALRRVAFAQLALPGIKDLAEKMRQPEDSLARLSRALPLWLSETLFFSPSYQASAALGVLNDAEWDKHYAVFGAAWSEQNVKQLVDSNKEKLDYVFTGSLEEQEGQIELVLHLWDAKKIRERKELVVSWTPETMDAELGKMHQDVCLFMEHSLYPEGQGMPYKAPASPKAWLDTLGISISLFLAEKGLVDISQVSDIKKDVENLVQRAPLSPSDSLACLTALKREKALKLGLDLPVPELSHNPLVDKAKSLN